MAAHADSVNVVNVVNMVPGWNSRRTYTCDPAAVVHTLAEHGVRLVREGENLRAFGALTDDDCALIREHKPALVALLAGAESAPATAVDAAPTTHCPACGSPSWWRAPSSPGWRCAYCEPRDRSRIEAHESLTLAGGQWAPGCAPPVPTPTTVAELLALHGETVAGCLLVDVLAEAADDDLPELRDRVLLEGFAAALVADRRIRPLPDASLPLLHRLALEIGDDVMELRRWLDQSAQGRRIRARIEREAGACDRCLMALRADPAGGLHAVLARALDGASHAEPVPARPAGGRVQDCYGAWRTADQHAAVADYDRHHWQCERCIRAGRGYGARCAEGERLHALTRAAS